MRAVNRLKAVGLCGRGSAVNRHFNTGTFANNGCPCCGIPYLLCNKANDQLGAKSNDVRSYKSSSWKQSSLMNTASNEESCHMRSILDNNKRWVSDRNKEDPEFFEKLSKPQQPKYLYFGCSDSRVPANEIMGLG